MDVKTLFEWGSHAWLTLEAGIQFLVWPTEPFIPQLSGETLGCGEMGRKSTEIATQLDPPAHSRYTAQVIAERQCPCETATTASRSLARVCIYQPAFGDPDRAVKAHAG